MIYNRWSNGIQTQSPIDDQLHFVALYPVESSLYDIRSLLLLTEGEHTYLQNLANKLNGAVSDGFSPPLNLSKDVEELPRSSIEPAAEFESIQALFFRSVAHLTTITRRRVPPCEDYFSSDGLPKKRSLLSRSAYPTASIIFEVTPRSLEGSPIDQGHEDSTPSDTEAEEGSQSWFSAESNSGIAMEYLTSSLESDGWSHLSSEADLELLALAAGANAPETPR